MKCPYCQLEIHFKPQPGIFYEYLNENGEGAEIGFGTDAGLCPSCNNLIVRYLEGTYYSNDTYRSIQEPFTKCIIIYPKLSIGISLSEEVPEEYAWDFKEASMLINVSPKASAALSRRCLQNFFHNHMGIIHDSLAEEINEFISKQDVPIYLGEAVETIRIMCNFSSYPLKSTNTGEIIDVETGEAEWLLEVLQTLFDFYFVLPKKHEQRTKELNLKLKSLSNSYRIS